MRTLKQLALLVLLFLAFLFFTISSYAKSVSSDISDNFFRLHILANSNSEEDQKLKLKVRNEILKYMETLSYDGLQKSDAINLTRDNLENFKEIAINTIKSEGYDYPVNLEIGNFYFPTKEYGNISLPAGYYDALKINIGKAEGNNWWCSLFPPLCFVDISSGVIDESSKETLNENLTDDEFDIITNDNQTVKLKFKLVEMFSK